MQEPIDFLWIIVCSALVFLMQAGFLCLESGLTRSKNSINVAIKNLADFCLTTFIYWLFSFALMFGISTNGIFGTTGFAIDFQSTPMMAGAFFVFQVMFCGASVTIISGAIAERIKFGAYLLITLVIAGLVYPVFGHWAWAGLDQGVANGWLNSKGFIDFAGSTVVHSVGGWAALAILLIIGSRHGRFNENGKAIPIKHSSLSQATLGTVLLFIGWLGFNGGSTLALNSQVSLIIVNTVIAGSVGACSAGLLGYAVQNKLNVTQFMNGCLGGLVAITAGCFAVSTPAAVMIGLVGGMIVIGVEQFLEYQQIDDAVGAIPVHLGAGIWGTLAVGLYGDLEVLATGLTRFEQVQVQFLGIASCAVWTLGVTYSLMFLINKIYPIRVSLPHEIIGLNVSEHGVVEENLADENLSDKNVPKDLNAKEDVNSLKVI
jgi:Amt family ammonium transporter